MSSPRPESPGAQLTPDGYQLRNALAAAGLELTPAQLATALAEAQSSLLVRGSCGAELTAALVADELERAVYSHACRAQP